MGNLLVGSENNGGTIHRYNLYADRSVDIRHYDQTVSQRFEENEGII